MNSTTKYNYDYTTVLSNRGNNAACGNIVNERYLAIIRERPFVLNIETVSICNAKCRFCPYPFSNQEKGYMSMDLYEKILGEYSSIGGGALLLTPILGEFFLDKHAIERIRLARSFDNIGTISLTTNALATNRFSDDDLATFFLGTNYLQISMGGVHEKQYSEMFGVDKFELAISNVERLVRIRDSVAPNYPIRIAFRVNVTEGELRSDPRFERFKSMNIETVIDSTFGNWGGSIGQSSLPEGSSYRPVLDVTKKRSPCFMFYLGLYVAANGIATACGCMDSELKLSVGDCKTDHLTDLWKGAVRSGYKHSFEQSNPPDICKKCNFYQDGEIFLQTPEVQAFEIGRFPFGY